MRDIGIRGVDPLLKPQSFSSSFPLMSPSTIKFMWLATLFGLWSSHNKSTIYPNRRYDTNAKHQMTNRETWHLASTTVQYARHDVIVKLPPSITRHTCRARHTHTHAHAQRDRGVGREMVIATTGWESGCERTQSQRDPPRPHHGVGSSVTSQRVSASALPTFSLTCEVSAPSTSLWRAA